jgi:tetratricopeptide (TPR) repeat protein
MPFRFLELPGELRNAVYKEVLSPASFREDLGDGKYRYNIDTTIFLTCRQFNFEARHVFYQSLNIVRVETPLDATQNSLQQDGIVPIIARGNFADKFQMYHMNVRIEAPNHGMLNRDSRKLLLLVEDLPKFCKVWNYWNLNYDGEVNECLVVTLEMKNPLNHTAELPVQTQLKLMEPFGMVKGIYQFDVTGLRSAEAETHLRRLIAIPEPSQEFRLEEAAKFKEMGNVALKKGNPDEALQFYFKSFESLHIVIMGRKRIIWADRWFDRVLKGGMFDKQNGFMVRLNIRVKLVANIVKAYLDKCDYDEAWYWGDRTIGLLRMAQGNQDEPFFNFPATLESGKIYYRTGLAAKMLGKRVEARHLFRVALRYLPNNKDVQRELERVV